MKLHRLSLLLVSLVFVSYSASAGDWSIVPSPNLGKQANGLLGIAAAADNDVWSVGLDFNESLFAYRTLAEHWDGVRWSVVRTPNATTGYNFLNAVAVVTSTNVWAVGMAATGSTSSTLVEHWDGRRWQIVTSPSPAGQSSTLEAVTIIAANDIWAVGYSQDANFVFHPLTFHYDGSTWSIVATTGQSRLLAVDAVASNDVWATGETEPGELSLTMHWDGSAWSVVPSPNDSTEDNILFGVAAVASNDVWAVGSAGSLKTLAIHWDGANWNLVPTPAISGDVSNPVLVGIVALSSSDIWAVGQYLLPLQGSAEQTLTEHWDGASWSVVASPDVKNSNNRLAEVTVTPDGTLWAAGTTGVFGKPEKTLILTKPPGQ